MASIRKMRNKYYSRVSWRVESYGKLKENPIDLIKYALKKNINFFDTAPLYGNGNVEKLIGSLDKKTRNKMVISTKCGMLPHVGFNMKQDFDIVIIGLDLDVKYILDYCLNANKVFLEYPITYTPSENRTNELISKLYNKEIIYDFVMDFSNIPLNIDLKNSWPPRYKRRIIILDSK